MGFGVCLSRRRVSRKDPEEFPFYDFLKTQKTNEETFFSESSKPRIAANQQRGKMTHIQLHNNSEREIAHLCSEHVHQFN